MTAHLRLPEPAPRPVQLAADAFHAHIDGCHWCANHPFALCGTGQDLLRDFSAAENDRKRQKLN